MVPLSSSTHRFLSSTPLQPSPSMSLKINELKQCFSSCGRTYGGIIGLKPDGMHQNPRVKVLCIMNMAAGQSDEPEKINFNSITDKARKLLDSTPQPVKNFPWTRALENFIQIVLDLIIAVVKYLCLPLLAISSLSEMSYCAHEKKLFIIPLPLLVGAAVAELLRKAALESSPLLKDAEVPWHLIAIAVFFTLLKLPGPYYPYWGRILVPHFANGGLWRTLWFTFLLYRKP